MKCDANNLLLPAQIAPDSTITFGDLFDLADIQRIQDAFAEASGVASIITDPAGNPITQPSNFCDLCLHIIRKTPLGLANCCRSDAVLGRPSADGPTTVKCLSGGLWDGGTSIIVDGHHVANWLVGQVMDETVDPERLVEYGKQIGADEEMVRKAIPGVPRMSRSRFEKVCEALHLIANQISTLALNNLNHARQLAELRLVQEAKSASEARLARVVRGTTDGIWDWNIQTGEDYHSPRYKELLGYADDEVPDTLAGFEALVHPDDLPRVQEAQSAHIHRGEPYNVELRMRTKQGDYKWFVTRGQMEQGAGGEPLRMSGSITDITERKQAEETLRASERRVEAYIEQASDAIYLLDAASGRILYCNRKACQYLGYSKEELLGLSAFDIEAGLKPSEIEEVHNSVPDQNDVLFEALHRRKDGTTFPVEISISRLDLDKPSRLLAIVRDITERRRAADLLQESERRLATLMSNLPGMAYRCLNNRDWTMSFVSDGCMGLTGYAAGDIVGSRRLSYADLILTEDKDMVWNEVQQAVLEKRAFRMTYRIRSASGAEKWVWEQGQGVFSADGTLEALEGFVDDITEVKSLEADLREALVQSEMATVAKSEFLANMSHEIRTPMNGVIGMTSLLLDTELAAEQRGYAENIRSSADALLNILNDILDISKIEAGRLELERIGFDLSRVLDDCAVLLAPRAKSQGVGFLCAVAPDVPVFLCGDPGRLRQVLLNLAGNAVKFTHHGEIAVRVGLVSQTDAAATLRFSIKDTGIGISADKQALIFQKFSQADTSTTRRYGGTGLGLAISKELVERMGGEIGVASNEGEGAEFWFTVSLERSNDVPPASPARARRPLLDSLCQAAGRILLVEDNIPNQEVIAGLLKKMGLHVDVVGNGAQALQSLATTPCDLVLMDLQMPVMDGFEAARKIRDPQSAVPDHEIPIIAVTAHAMRGDRDRCLSVGMNACVLKPVSPKALADALNQWLPKSSGAPPDPKVSSQTGRPALPVLVVEDDPTSSRVACKMLQRLGYQAELASSGPEALRVFAPEKFSAILMDLAMPVMDGLDTTRRIREAAVATGQRVPIIALTADTTPGERERCLAAGMDDFLSKPYKMDALAAMLARVVHR